MNQPFEKASQLLAAIEHHEAAEEESIRTYQELSFRAGDPLVSIVMRLILEDEDRHHTVLKRMAIMLRESPTLAHMAERPKLDEDDLRLNRERISAAIAAEQEGAQKLSALASEATGHADGVTSLLLSMLAKDSEKHETMLRFALDRLTPGSASQSTEPR
jgi:rubrerythrin